MAYSLTSPLVLLEDDLAQKGITLTLENLSFRKVRVPKAVQAILHPAEKMAYLQKSFCI